MVAGQRGCLAPVISLRIKLCINTGTPETRRGTRKKQRGVVARDTTSCPTSSQHSRTAWHQAQHRQGQLGCDTLTNLGSCADACSPVQPALRNSTDQLHLADATAKTCWGLLDVSRCTQKWRHDVRNLNWRWAQRACWCLGLLSCTWHCCSA